MLSAQKPKILVLYSELAEYTLACLQQLKEAGTEVHLVSWPVNPEAPFEFDLGQFSSYSSRKSLDNSTLLGLAKKIGPNLIICSGWMDKGYLQVCRNYKNQIPVVLTMDNKWEGRWKQRAAVLLAPFTLRKHFNRVWVPGAPQKEYALKLGFKEEEVFTGFYSANTPYFEKVYQEIFPVKEKGFPKKLLYIGRYIRHKGIFDLWEAFAVLSDRFPDWELHCCGTGDQWENRVHHPKIKHYGFVQPKDMIPILKQTGIYVLPSHFEPWGVSLHEMAIAGFPLLASNEVGAASLFLKEGENGHTFGAGNIGQLKNVLTKMMETPMEKLLMYGRNSHGLGTMLTPEKWAGTAMEILKSW